MIKHIYVCTLLLFIVCNVLAQQSPSPKEATAELQKANAAIESGQFQSALTHLHTIRKSLIDRNTDQYIDCLNLLANAHGRLSNFDSAIYYADKAIAIAAPASVPRIKSLHTLAMIRSVRGEYQLAIPLLELAQAAIQESKVTDIRLQSKIYQLLAVAYKGMQQNDKALGLLIKTLDLLRPREYLPKKRLIHLLLDIVNTYRNIGDNQNCISYLEEAIEINQQLPYPEPRVFFEAGVTYAINLQSVLSLEYFEKALTTYRRHNSNASLLEVSTLESMGIVHANLQQYAASIKVLKNALAIRRKKVSYDQGGIINCLTNLSRTYQSMASYDSALYYQDQAFAIQSANPQLKHFLYDSYANKADILRQQGKIAASRAAYHKAIDEITKRPAYRASIQAASYYNHLSASYEAEQPDSALYYAQQALIANSYTFKELFTDRNPEIDFALSKHIMLQTIIHKVAGYVMKYHQNHQEQDRQQAIHHYQLGEQLLQYMVRYAGNQEELLTYGNIAQSIYTDMLTLTNDPAEWFLYMELSKALTMRLNASEKTAKIKAGIPQHQLAKEDSLRNKVAQLSSALIAPPSANDQIIDSLFTAKRALDAHISFYESNFPTYFETKYQPQVITLATIQQQLAPDQLLIEYLESDSTLYALAIGSEQVSQHQIQFKKETKSLLRQHAALSRSLNPDLDNLSKISQQLYAGLVAPVLSHNDYSQKKRLSILPDGLLWDLNFEILSKGNSGTTFKNQQLLLFDHAISYGYSATLLFDRPSLPQKDHQKQVLAFSYGEDNIPSGSSISFNAWRSSQAALPGSSQEVKMLSALTDGDYYYGSSASEQHFKANAAQYQILHLAVHGETNPKDVEKSKLYFFSKGDSIEDGQLHVFELYQMQLNADLAVLSACETGTGKINKGEGVMSLGRAFSYAGVKSLLLTRWKVPDAYTPALIASFYEGLKAGYSKSEALRQAKITFLKTSDNISTNPVYWSSFYLLGNDSVIEFENDFPYKTFILIGITMVFVIVLIVLRRKTVSAK